VDATQVGWQGMADRYAYLPLIGIYLAVVWGMAEIAARSEGARKIVIASAVVAVSTLTTLTWFEIGHWRDSPTLFGRALEVTRHNAVAHNNLGNWLVAQERLDEGVGHLEQARQLIPDSPQVLGGLGEARLKQGRLTEAIGPLSRAVERQPSFGAARRNLAYVLMELGRVDEAAAQFTTLIEQQPDDARAHHKLGQIRLRQRRVEEAVAHHRLGLVQMAMGRPAEAADSFRAAIAADPGFAPARESLAAVLRGLGDEAGAREVDSRAP